MRKILIFIIITVLSLTSCDFTNDEYEGSNDIEKLLSWKPDEKQWWITGFNPEYVGNVDVHKQVMVGEIDMSEKPGLFKEFIKEYQYQIDRGVKSQWERLIVDTDNKIVWIMWGA